MNFSIFRGGTKEEKGQRHHAIHWVWKKKIAYPFIWYIERHIKKFMIRSIDDIPNEVYNRNFRILYYSVEKGIEDWYYNFYGGIKNGKKDKAKYKELEDKWPTRFNTHWWKVSKFFTNLLATICLEDTAYRELINQVMFRIQGEMNRQYNPEIKHKFPMYISMYESYIPFFVEWMRESGGGRLMMEVDNDKRIGSVTKAMKKVSLHKEAVDQIEKLNKGLQPRFKRDISIFILRLLGQEKKRVCSTCRQAKLIKDFTRNNEEFFVCNECSNIKFETKANGSTPTSAVIDSKQTGLIAGEGSASQ